VSVPDRRPVITKRADAILDTTPARCARSRIGVLEKARSLYVILLAQAHVRSLTLKLGRKARAAAGSIS